MFVNMKGYKALEQLKDFRASARPVPNFNKIFLSRKSSNRVTKPRLPKLKIIERIERRKMVAAVSTPRKA
nr:protein TPX2-like isoform X1 [Tanacetum cinerariifolium]